MTAVSMGFNNVPQLIGNYYVATLSIRVLYPPALYRGLLIQAKRSIVVLTPAAYRYVTNILDYVMHITYNHVDS